MNQKGNVIFPGRLVFELGLIHFSMTYFQSESKMAMLGMLGLAPKHHREHHRERCSQYRSSPQEELPEIPKVVKASQTALRLRRNCAELRVINPTCCLAAPRC